MKVKIYDPDDDMIEVEQVDARECVEMGYYTMEPVEKAKEETPKKAKKHKDK